MLIFYIESFTTGSIDAHKNSQRRWIADKGPVVETCMGWIEKYVDPENIRAYWEGFVTIVDKDQSRKFGELVKASEILIPRLPWPRSMEKEKFLAPDFTSLEVITFASKACPAGINIPNYDDIRETEGFKNFVLNNSLNSKGAKNPDKISFATQEQSDLLLAWSNRCYEVKVGCHELLGHGSGKLIYRGDSEETPTFTDPITGEAYQSCYEKGELYNEKFGTISTSYEECRADATAFFLSPMPEVYTLFGFKEEEVDTLLWVQVMGQFRKAIVGLQVFNPTSKRWC